VPPGLVHATGLARHPAGRPHIHGCQHRPGWPGPSGAFRRPSPLRRPIDRRPDAPVLRPVGELTSPLQDPRQELPHEDSGSTRPGGRPVDRGHLPGARPGSVPPPAIRRPTGQPLPGSRTAPELAPACQRKHRYPLCRRRQPRQRRGGRRPRDRGSVRGLVPPGEKFVDKAPADLASRSGHEDHGDSFPRRAHCTA
jgi:hypothetical protein